MSGYQYVPDYKTDDQVEEYSSEPALLSTPPKVPDSIAPQAVGVINHRAVTESGGPAGQPGYAYGSSTIHSDDGYEGKHLLPDCTLDLSRYICSLMGFDWYIHISVPLFLSVMCFASLIDNGFVSFILRIIFAMPLYLLPIVAHELARCYVVTRKFKSAFSQGGEAYSSINDGSMDVSADGKVILWNFGSLAPTPCNCFNRTDLREVISITCAGLTAMLATSIIWVFIAYVFDVEVFNVAFNLMHIERFFVGSFLQIAFATSWFLFVVNLIPAYPLDGATVLVAFMRYYNESEEYIVKTYLTANLFFAFNILALATAKLSSLWTLVSIIPLLQAVHLYQLRNSQSVSKHPLFRCDRLIVPETNVGDFGNR